MRCPSPPLPPVTRATAPLRSISSPLRAAGSLLLNLRSRQAAGGAVVSRYVIVRHSEFGTKQAEGSDAGKTSLWHGPGLLSLVADCHAPRPPMAGQRPRRPGGHRQPRALGLGGAGRHAGG